MVLISIITPVYNSASFLEKTIQSVLDQTYSCWEMIIVDDGSTDNSPDIIKEYQQKESRIHYIHQKNKGPGTARNVGIQHAKGELVAFLDSDDLWLSEKLERSVAEFLRGEQDLLFSDAYLLSEDNTRNLRGCPLMGVDEQTYQGKKGIADFLYRNRIPTLTVLVKREAILQVGGFEGDLSEDYYLWLKMLLEGFQLRSTSMTFALYQVHTPSLSSRDRYISRSVLPLLQALGERYELDWQQEYRPQIRNWIIRYVRKAFTRKDIPFLKEKLTYFGFYNKSLKNVLSLSSRLPFFVVKRLIRILIR